MIRELEYLDEAIEEAEAAARWYAERSGSAATGFADEIDTAIAAIEQNPEAWPPYDHSTRHYLLRRYPFSVVDRVEPPGFSWWRWRTGIGDRDTGRRGFKTGLANQPLHLTAPGPLARAPRARWYRDSRVPQVSGNALGRPI